MKTGEFTSGQIAKAIGVEYQCLRGWLDTETFKPVQPPGGRGTKVLYNTTDAHMAGLLKECLALGMSRKEAALAIKDVRKRLKAMKNPGAVSHILFVKRNGEFFKVDEVLKDGKKYKTMAAAILDSLETGPLPSTILMDEKTFQKTSLLDVMTWGQRFKRDADYTSFVVINYGKIVKNIDLSLRD